MARMVNCVILGAEAEGLVAPELGHDRAGMGRVPVEETVLKTTETEEVVLLLEVVDRPFVDRAEVVIEQLVVGVVLLAGHAVLAGVGVEFDVTGVVTALEHLGDGCVVSGFRGPDEVVVGDVEPAPGIGELRGDRVTELLRGQTRGVGGLTDLAPGCVGSGEGADASNARWMSESTSFSRETSSGSMGSALSSSA